RTHATYLRRGRGVGDVHRERGGFGIEVRTAERGAELLAERTLGAAGPVLPCEASQCLLLGEFEVTLHRGDDLTRWSEAVVDGRCDATARRGRGNGDRGDHGKRG